MASLVRSVARNFRRKNLSSMYCPASTLHSHATSFGQFSSSPSCASRIHFFVQFTCTIVCLLLNFVYAYLRFVFFCVYMWVHYEDYILFFFSNELHKIAMLASHNGRNTI